jgi:formylmethanofuran dehydrogenase subunit E
MFILTLLKKWVLNHLLVRCGKCNHLVWSKDVHALLHMCGKKPICDKCYNKMYLPYKGAGNEKTIL